MLSCQHDKPDRPEVRDPPPKGPPGLAPLPEEEEGLDGDTVETDPTPTEEGPARPEVRDPPPKGPIG
jgi:hypothetical protein